MTEQKKTPKDRLVQLVEKEAAENPFDFDGFKWAARPHAFYLAELGFSQSTLSGLVKNAPFVRRPKIIGATVTVNGEDVNIEGGTKVSLLRIGDPADKGPHEYALIMRGVWKNKTGWPLTEHHKKLLYGMAKDMVEHFPGISPVDVFVHALDNWQQTAGAIKIAMMTQRTKTPSFDPQFHYFPCIGSIRRFYKAAIHVYVMDLQSKGKIVPFDGEITPESIAKHCASAALLQQTDPWDPDFPCTDDTPIDAVFPFKEPWKPVPSGGKSDA